MLLKGIFYNNQVVYNFISRVFLGKIYNQRFNIAKSYIQEGDCVLDVCAGFAQLRGFLSKTCTYCALDGNESCIRYFKKNRIKHIQANLHNGFNLKNHRPDVVVMLISLCQFRFTSAPNLLESFKKFGKKVVIIEDVYPSFLRSLAFFDRLKHYLCSCSVYRPAPLFTRDEFLTLLNEHQYRHFLVGNRYVVGLYEKTECD